MRPPRSPDPFADDHYLVLVGAYDRPAPRVVDGCTGSARGISLPGCPADAAERLAADPDVTEAEPDTVERLAPHHRVPGDVRVSNTYMLEARRTSRPTTVAARAGVVRVGVFDYLNPFGVVCSPAG
jgi:hypothetical protein